MRRTPTMLTGLVVALLLALAGTTAASASTPSASTSSASTSSASTSSGDPPSMSGHHATTPGAPATQHRAPSAPRPNVTVVGHLGHDLVLQIRYLRTTRAAAEPEPVITTSFCSNHRAPPV